MENNIEEAYVSFEAAKLLKEKGFDCLCRFYMKEGSNEKHSTWASNSMFKNRIYIPTQQMAVEWLRINYDTFIEIIITTKKMFFARTYWEMSKTHKGMGNFDYFDNVKQLDNDFHCYNSPQEATNAALLYTLQNLIK